MRLKYMDGLRGLMSLAVIVCHFICVFYPQMYTASWVTTYGSGEYTGLALFSVTPLAVFTAGNEAVQCFFILTGFFSALSVFRHEQTDILKLSVKRYFRLLPLVAVATLFTLCLMEFGLMHHLEIAEIVSNGDYLRSSCNFEPTLRSFLESVFITPFFYGKDFTGYVLPFWTIKFEFWGYILVLLVCIISKGMKWRRLGYAALAVYILFNGPDPDKYCAFIFGVFLADLYYYTEPQTTFLSGIYTGFICKKQFLIPFYILGMFFVCIPHEACGIYSFLPIPYFGGTAFYRAAGMAICLWCFMNSPITQAILEWKPLQWLGKISFSTYALHWPIMLSVEAGLFEAFISIMSYDAAALSAFALTLPVIFAVSYLSWRAVENGGIKRLITKRTELRV